jgi:hypothetical protein
MGEVPLYVVRVPPPAHGRTVSHTADRSTRITITRLHYLNHLRDDEPSSGFRPTVPFRSLRFLVDK